MSPRRRVRGISLATAAVLLLPAFAQTTSTTTTSTTGTTGGNGSTLPTGGSTGANNTTTSTGSSQPRPTPRPVTITGRVMLEDGAPPPSLAVIERVCNGAPHAEGYTDSKGYFAIQLGQDLAVMADASESESGFGRTFPQASGASTGTGAPGAGTGSGRGFGSDNRFGNCDLRARLGGYRSQSINLLNHGPMDNPEVGIILLHRLAPAESDTVTATTLTATKPARKAFQKGMDLEKKKKPEEALASLREAVQLDPQFASAWHELGKLQVDRGDTEGAHQSFEAAVQAEPRWPNPYLELSLLAVNARHWKELADITDHVLRLNSFDYPQAFYYNAVANFYLKHLDAAEKSARSAERLDTEHRHPQTAHLLGTILAIRNQYAAAAEELRNYLVMAPDASDAPAVRKQLDEVEKLALQGSEVARKDPR
jgi:thioredoxin-like negative regulator of GroEL